MAHKEQTEFVIECLNSIKKEFNYPNVLEIGSYNVNSIVEYKKHIGNCNYVGIDLIEGSNVDVVLKGEDIGKLGKKFNIIICCECFEHTKNWKIIFSEMIKYIEKTGYIIITAASTGRAEHGTERTNNSDSPGTGNYYKNITKNDFFKNFNIKKIFKDFFFFNNINSYDLYVVLKKEKNNQTIELIKKNYLMKYKKTPKLKNLIKYIICLILGDKNLQNLIFLLKKI